MKINKAIYILSCLLLSIFLFGCKESQLKITVFDKLPDSPLLNEVKSSIDDKKPLAIAFTAEWCPHCRKYKPIFIEVQDGYKDRITFINIDVDDTNGQTITQRFQVKGIPTTAFIRPDGSVFKVQVGKSETDLRISTLPTIYGEKVVIRLLKEEGTVFSFRDLGMRGSTLKRFEEASLKPNGMLLVTGHTGSGKTVTLASALSKLNTVRVNIVTLEDPVEIRVPGVNQVQVNPQAGLDFADGLRSFLRQDPNIIMVGEIRDGDTAELAVHAALTGHLVLSTLHTNSAAGALPRLLDMGVENFLLASTVNAILAQRLVRKICVDCKEEYEPPEEVQESVKKIVDEISENKTLLARDPEISKILKNVSGKEKLTLWHGKGCPKCSNTGYRGRIGIYELLYMTEDISRLILENAPSSKIHETAVKLGMLTLLQDGYLRIVEGITTLEEVLRVAK